MTIRVSARQVSLSQRPSSRQTPTLYTASEAAVLFNFEEAHHIAPMHSKDHLDRMASGEVGDLSTTPDVLRAIRDAVGPKGWIEEAGALQPYLREERGLFFGHCAAVVRPATTEELARVVTLCAGASVPVVPHGGNTGLVGGGVPRGGVVISTARLNRIRSLDKVNRTMTVEAGVILADAQSAADRAGALFPLSLAAEEAAGLAVISPPTPAA